MRAIWGPVAVAQVFHELVGTRHNIHDEMDILPNQRAMSRKLASVRFLSGMKSIYANRAWVGAPAADE